MESRIRGGIASHLAAIRQATSDRLTFEYPDDEAGQDEFLFRLTQDELTVPEVPEVLAMLRESRDFHIPIFEGSLMDLPYFFHLELNACVQAENEFFNLRAINQKLREQWKHAHKDTKIQ